MDAKYVKVDLLSIGLFRKATPEDITEGNIVFLIGDGDEMHKKTIEEVYRPDDDWKAFCAEDGCRYGLYDLWVLKSGVELEKRVQKLEGIIEQIRGSLNAL
jgi:hypothetical protein